VWKRNLLFVGLVIAGAGSLGSLFPSVTPASAGRRPPVPAPPAGNPEVVDRVDQVFHRQWADEGLSPARRAPELAVMRRLALGLMGTIPSLEEIRRFEADPGDQRLSTWLDGVLKDRRFADYFAERLARAFVGTEGGPFIVFRRRRFVTWLSDQIMEDRPYDRVVCDLIADKGLWTDHPGTNFVSVTYDPEKKEPDPERLAARVARAFLGVRLDCAQCHDHPFESWKQRDFQGLAAFFGQVHSGLTGIHDGTGEFEPTNRKTGKPVTVEPRVPFFPELWPHDGTRRSQLARWVTDPKNPHLPRVTVNRVWALLFGRPLVEPVDDLATAGEPPEVLRILADDLVAHGFDLKRLVRVIAATEVFRLDSASVYKTTEAHEKAWAVFPMTRLRPDQVVGGIVQAASVERLDAESHILLRVFNGFGKSGFVQRYGDTGEDEFSGGSGTIPQRLLMLNGELVHDKTKDSVFNASTRIAMLAPDDHAAVEVAYLTALTRRPTPDEAAHFEAKLAGASRKERELRLSDLCWTLLNATEFSWNH
jgi:hypothetical protein